MGNEMTNQPTKMGEEKMMRTIITVEWDETRGIKWETTEGSGRVPATPASPLYTDDGVLEINDQVTSK